MSSASRRVLVVGAGLAGLAAAQRLSASGCATTVLEARARAGGKYAGETLEGLAYAPWPGLVVRSAPALVGLSAELGLALAREPLGRVGWLRGAHVRTGSLELARALGRSPLAAARARRLVLLLSWLGDALDPEAPERATRLDDRSVADFCRVYLGRRVLEERLAPLFATLFGVDARETSRQRLFASLDADATLGLDLVPRADALVEALAAHAGELRLGAAVASVAADGSSLKLASGEALEADAIVLAVPPGEVARLMPDAPHAARLALERLRTGSALVLALLTRPGVAPAARVVLVPEREGGELAGVVDVTPAGERERSLLLLVARPDLAARHGRRADAELAYFLIESGARVVPGLAAGVLAQRLHRHAPPAFGVGHFRELARLRGASELALAGDWLAAPHVEGELASGLRAAREVALSRPASRR